MASLIKHAQGGQVVFIEDEVADHPSSEGSIRLVEASKDVSGIWVQSERIVEARNAHPGKSTYGIWQTIFASDVWRKGDYDSVVFYTNAEEEQGVLLSIKEKRCTITAEIIGGMPVGIVSDRPLTVTWDQLAKMPLPKTRILLPSELKKLRSAQVQKSALLAAAYLAAAGIGGYLLDIGLQSAADARRAEAASLRREEGDLKLAIEREAAKKPVIDASSLARQRVAISRLMELEATAGPLRAQRIRPNDGGETSVEVSSRPEFITFPARIVEVPHADRTVVFTVDGSDSPDWDPASANFDDIVKYAIDQRLRNDRSN